MNPCQKSVCLHRSRWYSYADYTIALKADAEMLCERLIRRKTKTGMTREDAGKCVEFSDMLNVRLCVEKAMKADLELSV